MRLIPLVLMILLLPTSLAASHIYVSDGVGDVTDRTNDMTCEAPAIDITDVEVTVGPTITTVRLGIVAIESLAFTCRDDGIFFGATASRAEYSVGLVTECISLSLRAVHDDGGFRGEDADGLSTTWQPTAITWTLPTSDDRRAPGYDLHGLTGVRASTRLGVVDVLGVSEDLLHDSARSS